MLDRRQATLRTYRAIAAVALVHASLKVMSAGTIGALALACRTGWPTSVIRDLQCSVDNLSTPNARAGYVVRGVIYCDPATFTFWKFCHLHSPVSGILHRFKNSCAGRAVIRLDFRESGRFRLSGLPWVPTAQCAVSLFDGQRTIIACPYHAAAQTYVSICNSSMVRRASSIALQ